MNVSFKKSLLVAALSTGMIAASSAHAEFSANIGAASNYIWRGVTQTNDEAAISGGLDYASESGFYAGTWASNLAGSQYELDLYAGFGGEAGSVGYDLGVITYLYPIGDDELDFTEVYASASVAGFTAGVAYEISAEDDADSDVYLSLAYDMDLSEDVGLSIYGGDYSFDADSSADYTHYGVSVAKGDFGFAIDKTDQDDAAGDPRVTVSWGTSF